MQVPRWRMLQNVGATNQQPYRLIRRPGAAILWWLRHPLALVGIASVTVAVLGALVVAWRPGVPTIEPVAVPTVITQSPTPEPTVTDIPTSTQVPTATATQVPTTSATPPPTQDPVTSTSPPPPSSTSSTTRPKTTSSTTQPKTTSSTTRPSSSSSTTPASTTKTVYATTTCTGSVTITVLGFGSGTVTTRVGPVTGGKSASLTLPSGGSVSMSVTDTAGTPRISWSKTGPGSCS